MTATRHAGPLTTFVRDTRAGSLFSQIVDTLGADIVSGKLATGELLFADRLCKSLGVSRSVIREVLRALSSMGLVEARPQVGTRVLPPSRWNLLDPQVVSWRGRGSGYRLQQRELLELRLGIESAAARLAARRMTSDEVAGLRDHTAQMHRSIEASDPHGFFDADADFHRGLLEGSGNAVLSQFAKTVSAVLQVRSFDTRPGMMAMRTESVHRHDLLVDALAAGDPDQARQRAWDIVFGTLAEFDDTAVTE